MTTDLELPGIRPIRVYWSRKCVLKGTDEMTIVGNDQIRFNAANFFSQLAEAPVTGMRFHLKT